MSVAFVQYYGSRRLDASLLMMPLVGFLPADDARVPSTIEAIERELVTDGFVHRYRPTPRRTGFPRVRVFSCSAPSGLPTAWP